MFIGGTAELIGQLIGGLILMWLVTTLFLFGLAEMPVPRIVIVASASLLSLGVAYLVPKFLEGYFGQRWSVHGADYVIPQLAVFFWHLGRWKGPKQVRKNAQVPEPPSPSVTELQVPASTAREFTCTSCGFKTDPSLHAWLTLRETGACPSCGVIAPAQGDPPNGSEIGDSADAQPKLAVIDPKQEPPTGQARLADEALPAQDRGVGRPLGSALTIEPATAAAQSVSSNRTFGFVVLVLVVSNWLSCIACGSAKSELSTCKADWSRAADYDRAQFLRVAKQLEECRSGLDELEECQSERDDLERRVRRCR